MKSFFPWKLFASRNQTDWPPYIASILNIKIEQASFLIGWTVVAMVTEDNFVSIAYLKTAAPSIDQLYYHKFLIHSVSVGLPCLPWKTAAAANLCKTCSRCHCRCHCRSQIQCRYRNYKCKLGLSIKCSKKYELTTKYTFYNISAECHINDTWE